MKSESELLEVVVSPRYDARWLQRTPVVQLLSIDEGAAVFSDSA
jgi:hypothetical protein